MCQSSSAQWESGAKVTEWRCEDETMMMRERERERGACVSGFVSLCFSV